MVLVAVDDGEDLEGGLVQHIFHGFADFGAFWSVTLVFVFL
jgi:hypothetical protein